ncbi:MAG: hypothetical protein EBT17_05830, partial [Actinobacteria bacterium]|nr:hypothetical protein [Actinomycetota bacterium]
MRRWYSAHVLVEDAVYQAGHPAHVLVEDAVYQAGHRISGTLDLRPNHNGASAHLNSNNDLRSASDDRPLHTDMFEWVGFVDPTEDELLPHAKRLGINPLAIEDALSRTQRAKLDRYDDHTSLLVKTIAYDTQRRRIDVGDVTLIFARHYVFTVRHGAVLPLRDVRSHLESSPERIALGPAVVLHEFLDRLVDEYLHTVEALQRDLIEIEDEAFGDDRHLPTGRAYMMKREVL